MVAQSLSHDMSVDEWRELERVSHDTKHEYIDGHVYAMLGGSLIHSSIGSNVVRGFKTCYAQQGNHVISTIQMLRYDSHPGVTLTLMLQ